MILPWSPIIAVDIAGSLMTLLFSGWCAYLAWWLSRSKPDDVFRNFIFLFTLAILCFAVSRSFGHLVKQLLLMAGMTAEWKRIEPLSGAINSITFVVVFALSLSFHRFQKVHAEVEYYRENLESEIRKRTFELEQAKNTLENILNNSNPINITGVNFDLIRANEAYYALWPKGQSGERQIKCYESRPGAHCFTEECPVRQIAEGREEVHQEVTKIIGGEPRHFVLMAKPFRDVDGTLIGTVESFQDITTIKQAEDTLREMDRMKTDFISTAAHELNTPLSAILGYAELLGSTGEFGIFSEEQKQDFVREISERGEALSRITADLLDISRIESGNPVPLALEETDLIEVLTRKYNLFRTQYASREFRLDVPDQPNRQVLLIDRQRIGQALDNLLSNALKYSPKDKAITLRGREGEFGWEVRVEDQGVGMNPEQLARVFDKFYRADASNTAASGLGLGMSIARQIIEAHGGSIRVESVVGEGTTAIFTLPHSTPTTLSPKS